MKNQINKIRHYGIQKSFRLLIPFMLRNYYLKQRQLLIKRNGLAVLATLVGAFRAHQVVHWLEYGTLLGIIRDGKLIENDLDIDIGVYPPPEVDYYKNILVKYGFKRLKLWLINDKVVEETYTYKGVHLDLYYFAAAGDRLFTYTCYRERTIDTVLAENEFNVIKYSYHGYAGVKIHTFAGIELLIPENYELLLEQKYGNWRERNPGWTIFDSPVAEKSSAIANLQRDSGCRYYQ